MNTLALAFDSLTVPAGTVTNPGTVKSPKGGRFFYLRSTTTPLQIAFDSGTPFQMEGGFKVTEPFASVQFFNPTAFPIVVVFYIGSAGIDYVGTNDVKLAATYALGNLGIAVSAAAANGLPACDANGFLIITNSMNLLVPGTNNGHRRQKITFSVSTASPSPLNLLDLNGNVYMTIFLGQQIALTEDSTFILSGAGGNAWVTVGQTFYTN